MRSWDMIGGVIVVRMRVRRGSGGVGEEMADELSGN